MLDSQAVGRLHNDTYTRGRNVSRDGGARLLALSRSEAMHCANCQEPDDACGVCAGAGLVRGRVQ